jgi:GNAT superfamily N-acetyltransferase
MNDLSNRLVEGIQIREFSCQTDSLDELTELLHRSYKVLADMGFRFVASYQDSERTLERIKHGKCLVALWRNQIIGTICYYPPRPKDGSTWYDRPGVAKFGQFAVDPDRQQLGLGNQLLAHVEEIAKLDGVEELALDTAEGASHLIRYYSNRGYRFVEYIQGKTTNYRSVIMSKPLLPADHASKNEKY